MLRIIVGIMRLLFSLFSNGKPKDRIALLSRQGSTMPIDYQLLIDRIEATHPGIEIVSCLTNYASDGLFGYSRKMIRQIKLAATSRVIVVNGYVQAVCVPKDMSGHEVIQIWHALGAIKKFGLSSLGTEAGRTEKQASVGCMHKNYDCIIAGGPGATEAYCKSFGYGPEAIVALGMPRIDGIRALGIDGTPEREEALAKVREHLDLGDGRFNVLYAPTMRQDAATDAWLSDSISKLASRCPADSMNLLVSGHPLTKSDGSEAASSGNVIISSEVKSLEMLTVSDCVITDYSAIAFEAWLAGVPVFFYVPDIESYRKSPGLFIDPLIEFPSRSSADADVLMDAVLAFAQGGGADDPFSAFCESYFAGVGDDVTGDVVEFIVGRLGAKAGDRL
ncbi:MAG: CDP-glycerol glycerophosphotransferase family protein [Coriobacteriales bacterium]|nr:CDP-glycerol glycerophosphotransferase family protein [Coriobacteriales bacterium]